MSDSSSASGSRSHGGGGGVQIWLVAYSIGLAYHPAVQCECKGKPKACIWISWDDENPGRRYHRCQRSTVPALDCGFFHWFDEEEVSDWYKELLRDLRDAVLGLKKEGAKQEAKLEAVEKKLIAKQMEVEEEKNKLEAVEQKLIAKQMEVGEEKSKLEAKQLELYQNNQNLIAMRQQLTNMQCELIGKQQELQAKDEDVQALEDKLKKKNMCIDILFVSVLGLVAFLLLALMHAKKALGY